MKNLSVAIFKKLNGYIRVISFLLTILFSESLIGQTITIDGNPSDWPAVLNSSTIPVKVFTHDAANSINDNRFSLGTKDVSPISEWAWSSNLITATRDIENAGAALINNNLYFFGDRRDTTFPITSIGVWFLLNPVSPSGTGSGGFTGSNSVGDILVLFSIPPFDDPSSSPGHEIPALYIYEWVGEGGDQADGTLNFLGETTNAAVNTIEQTVPVFPNWIYNGLGGPNSYAKKTFFEGYIDVSNLSNRCFKSFFLASRSSTVITADPIDFSFGPFGGSNDLDNDGFTACNDCNDNNAAINSAATEVCDGIDNNCNGQVDEGFTLTTYYADADGDGFGDPAVSVQQCSPPFNYVTNDDDCNDANAAIKPGAAEVCDGVDNNCNGQVDEGLTLITYYADADGDGYGDPTVSVQQCSPPSNYVINNGDCNDGNGNINPGVTEICGNSIDDNCNGQTDEGCAPMPTVSINDVTVYESQGQAILTISLSNTSTSSIKINYKTIDGTAGKKDYKNSNGSITIPAGSLTAQVNVTIIQDNNVEVTEYFDVQITVPKVMGQLQPAVAGDDLGRVTILDGVAPSLTNKSNNLNEVGSGKFNVRLISNPSRTDFTLNIQNNSTDVNNISVFDLQGRLVKQIKTSSSRIQFGNELNAGIYIIEVQSGINKKILRGIKL